MKAQLEKSLRAVKAHIEREEYKGIDPYDALSSPIFKLPFFTDNRTIRFLFQQLGKRLPVNFRPIMGIKKSFNPVTGGLCIQAYTRLAKANLISNDEATARCRSLIDLLKAHIPKGYNGACWGYDFPWQSRHFKLDAYEPSVVATGIIVNALFEYYQYSRDIDVYDLCISSSGFILKDLNQYHEAPDSICFSYTPFDNYKVYNASMKAVRLLAQVYSLNGDETALQAARAGCKFVAGRQNRDGSWFYASGDKGNWIDSYHTGYVLECMREYMIRSGDNSFAEQIHRGFDFFTSSFTGPDHIPKFYHSKKYPLDCTSAAQIIITCHLFGMTELAEKVALKTVSSMQNEKGGFYFRKFQFYTNKINYMRWSDAWMFAALASLTGKANS